MKIKRVLLMLCISAMMVVTFMAGAFTFDKNKELKIKWDTIVGPVNFEAQKITGRSSYRIIPEFNDNHLKLDLSGKSQI